MSSAPQPATPLQQNFAPQQYSTSTSPVTGIYTTQQGYPVSNTTSTLVNNNTNNPVLNTTTATSQMEQQLQLQVQQLQLQQQRLSQELQMMRASRVDTEQFVLKQMQELHQFIVQRNQSQLQQQNFMVPHQQPVMNGMISNTMMGYQNSHLLNNSFHSGIMNSQPIPQPTMFASTVPMNPMLNQSSVYSQTMQNATPSGFNQPNYSTNQMNLPQQSVKTNGENSPSVNGQQTYAPSQQ